MSDSIFVDTNILLSEDLSHGATYFGIVVENPFSGLT